MEKKDYFSFGIGAGGYTMCKKGRIFIVNSVKGGVGKSTVSLYLAHYLQEEKKNKKNGDTLDLSDRPIIIDLDLSATAWRSSYQGSEDDFNAEKNDDIKRIALRQNQKGIYKGDDNKAIFINDMLYNAEKYLKREYCCELYYKVVDAYVQPNSENKTSEDVSDENVLDACNAILTVDVNEELTDQLSKALLKTLHDNLEKLKSNLTNNEVSSFIDVKNDIDRVLKDISDFKISESPSENAKTIKSLFESAKKTAQGINNVVMTNNLEKSTQNSATSAQGSGKNDYLRLILANSEKLTSLNDDALDLLESIVFKLVKHIWNFSYECVKDKKEENSNTNCADIIFDLPPGYEKHTERIIRHLIMDLSSDMNKEKIKPEYFLLMVSNVDEASFMANKNYVNNMYNNPIYSMKAETIKPNNIFYILNEVNGKLDIAWNLGNGPSSSDPYFNGKRVSFIKRLQLGLEGRQTKYLSLSGRPPVSEDGTVHFSSNSVEEFRELFNSYFSSYPGSGGTK